MREGNAEETNETDWFEQLQINLTTPFLLIKYALPLLRVSKGSIINVGSIEGLEVILAIPLIVLLREDYMH